MTTLSALMSQALFDQDINCRTVGRCVYGPPLDREVGDLVPRDGQGAPIPLSTDLGRAFLYARYNAELTRSGLAALGLPELDPTAGQRARLHRLHGRPRAHRRGGRCAG